MILLSMAIIIIIVTDSRSSSVCHYDFHYVIVYQKNYERDTYNKLELCNIFTTSAITLSFSSGIVSQKLKACKWKEHHVMLSVWGRNTKTKKETS